MQGDSDPKKDKVKDGIEDTAPDKIQLTKEELKNIVNAAIDEKLKSQSSVGNAEYLEEILETMRDQTYGQSGLRNRIRPLSAEEIDMNDYMDDPAVFFTYSFSYGVLGDKRYGHEIKTPFNRPIKFEPLFRYKKAAMGRGEEIVSMSSVSIHSKKEAQWLREHSLYGIRFFEKLADAQSIDKTFADALAESSHIVNGFRSEHEMINKAKQIGVELVQDLEQLKRSVIYKMAEDEMKMKDSRKPTIDHDGISIKPQEVGVPGTTTAI